MAKETRAKIELFTDPREAVDGAQAVYTDAWTSMGFEAEEKVRSAVFTPYQVNAELMALAGAGRRFHALSSGASRLRSHAGSSRWPAIGRARSVGKPHVRAESDPAHSVPIYDANRRSQEFLSVVGARHAAHARNLGDKSLQTREEL